MDQTPSPFQPAGFEGLGDLAAQADAIDATGAPPDPNAPPEPEPVAAGLTNTEVINGGLVMLRDVFCMVSSLDSPKATFTDAQAGQVAALWGAVADRRNWDLQRYMGQHADIGAACAVTLPIALAVHAGVRAELAARAPLAVETVTPRPVAPPPAPVPPTSGAAFVGAPGGSQ